MNGGEIWWGRIGNSLKLLDNVTRHLRDEQSVVLCVPELFPWRDVFYSGVDERRASFSGERHLKRLAWKTGEEPGRFVLEKLCPETVKVNYWPGMSYAQYLAEQRQLLLNDYFVWVTGVHVKAELSKWESFITQYSQYASEGAVFVLEYDGTPPEQGSVERIEYKIESYDCQVFCLEAAAALENTALLSYQAQLAQSIGGSDPELCAALLAAGETLLRDPGSATSRVVVTKRRTDGSRFPPVEEQQTLSAAWKAAIVLLFPMLERFRADFVEKHNEELTMFLPITNSYGEQVTDVCELEIGQLYFITRQNPGKFTSREQEEIFLCRRVRNLLAHVRAVPYEEVVSLVTLSGEQ